MVFHTNEITVTPSGIAMVFITTYKSNIETKRFVRQWCVFFISNYNMLNVVKNLF